MKLNVFKNRIIHGIATAAFLLLAGCAVPVSSDVLVTVTETPSLEPTIISTPTPVATATPTVTPTSTPTPSPTEIPLYDRILAWEANNEADPEIPVKAALLVNIADNSIIYSDHATETIYPASITKLMTAYVAFSAGVDLTQTVEISKTAVTPVIPSAKMCGFKAGDRILLKDLLGCMLVYSGNDTSVAVAEHISGSENEFLVLMNQKAEELQLKSSYFCNSHGLPDDNHVTSAYDIYLIMQKLFNFEEFLGIIELSSIEVDILRENSLHTFHFDSTNQFLLGTYQLPNGITLLGGKTGTTNKAGCCLTLYVKDNDGNCYIAEIFGAESYEALYSCMIQLLNHISEE